MPKLKKGLQRQENQWGIVKFFSSIWSNFTAIFNYFRSIKMEYSVEEAGGLMRSCIENNNRYEKITSWWCEHSAWKKGF